MSLATVQTSPCGRGLGDLLREREVGAEQRGHRALADRHRLLHRLAAQLQQLRRRREVERARRAQRRIFAEAMPGDEARHVGQRDTAHRAQTPRSNAP